MTAEARPQPIRPDDGPRDPIDAAPPLVPGAVRRTTTADVAWGGPTPETMVAHLRGHDVIAGADGAVVELGQLELDVTVRYATGTIEGVAGAEAAGLEQLLGANVRSGLGRRLAEAFGEELAARTLRTSVLEDLNGATLVAGYSVMDAGLMPAHTDPERVRELADRLGDVCAGWATGTPLLRSLADGGRAAQPGGPAAPVIELGWHRLDPLAEHTVRRRRLLDVSPLPDGRRAVWSHLRDSHRSAAEEMVMHEYVVTGEVDADRRVATIVVEGHVLPWAECPGAAGSASAAVGVPVDDLAAFARTTIVGPTSCTHLSSTVRCWADLTALWPIEEGP